MDLAVHSLSVGLGAPISCFVGLSVKKVENCWKRGLRTVKKYTNVQQDCDSILLTQKESSFLLCCRNKRKHWSSLLQNRKVQAICCYWLPSSFDHFPSKATATNKHFDLVYKLIPVTLGGQWQILLYDSFFLRKLDIFLTINFLVLPSLSLHNLQHARP